MALNTLQEWVLILSIVIHLFGCLQYRALAKKTGWLLPFVLWSAVVVGMIVPRILSQLIYEGLLPFGAARTYSTYIFFLNSILVVWSGICFSSHFDRWIDRLRTLEVEAQAAKPIVTEVQEDADA